MGLQDVIALTIVAVACYYVARSVFKQMRGGSCGCDAACKQEENAERTRIKRTPLVSLETKTNATGSSTDPPDHRKDS